MAIIGFSGTNLTLRHALCVICAKNRPLDELTTGLVGGGGHPAFACISHLNKADERAWFRGWLNFIVRLHLVTAFASTVKDSVILS